MIRALVFLGVVLSSALSSANIKHFDQFGNLDLQVLIQHVDSLFGDPLTGGRPYPVGPDHNLTPGEICQNPDTYRYPEHIAYCERDVDSSLKWKVIEKYNDVLGYDIQAKDRSSFKIDHYIPLCMGGANAESNLWPQHKSVYVITDPLEAEACAKMSAGKLLQKKAIELIFEAKNDLSKAPAVLQQIRAL